MKMFHWYGSMVEAQTVQINISKTTLQPRHHKVVKLSVFSAKMREYTVYLLKTLVQRLYLKNNVHHCFFMLRLQPQTEPSPHNHERSSTQKLFLTHLF